MGHYMSALELSGKNVFDGRVLQRQLCVHALEFAVLSFNFFDSL